MIGTKLAHYEITSHLGSGGMGEVYQATDAKLGRSVAIKLLPEAFTHDADRTARFEREARLLASLNHSNIAAIHGIEEADGRKFLVMELVSGETLAERIKRGPLPIDEALPIAKQIADGLEAAHEKGIIHRDLKPANIKITPQGQVKVLDFGLAKAFAGEAAEMNLSNSPTLSMAATKAGVILGTAAYMSPEQAKGKETDRTTDIWAFGCVLYEMLVGRAAFEGETLGEILGSVFKAEPDWSRLPAGTPAAIQRLLRRALKKDPRQRLSDIRDARLEIDEAQSGPQPDRDVVRSAPSGASIRKERLAWISALALLTLIAAMAILFAFRPVPEARAMYLDIAAPPTTDPASLAISPDGTKLIFAALSEGYSRLWVRSLDSVSSRPLPGTDGGRFPFWSPDSRSIGFFADSGLKRIDIDSGSVQTLADSSSGRGGAWNRDGTILFAPTPNSPIFRLSATGGERTQVTRLEGQQPGHRFPQFLADGQSFLYYVQGEPQARGIYVGHLDGSGPRRLLDQADGPAVVSSSGQLLFVRQGTLFAQNLDPARLELSGNPFSVAEQVMVDANTDLAAVSTSAAGPIVYRTGVGALRQLVWFDRSGQEIGKVWDPYSTPALSLSFSPDERHVGLERTVNGNRDIWLVEVGTGRAQRFTSGDSDDQTPVWSPDGSRIAFNSNRSGPFDLFVKPAGGAGSEKLLLPAPTVQSEAPNDWSADGGFLLFKINDPNSGYDLWALQLGGDRKPFVVRQTNFDERDGQFSPDSKWIAYQSNESGRFEIYLQSFPVAGARWTVSTNGGAQVRWRRDGEELFYIALDGRLMAVPIELPSNGQTPEVGVPTPLFSTRVGGAVQGASTQQYMVSRDGGRFLMNTLMEEAASPITVMLNWKPKP